MDNGHIKQFGYIPGQMAGWIVFFDNKPRWFRSYKEARSYLLNERDIRDIIAIYEQNRNDP